MKNGKNLIELATELERQLSTKKDYVAESTAVRMMENGTEISGLNGGYGIGEIAHEQIAARLKIPRDYYNRMRQDTPDLLAANVNRWMQKNPERRLYRTMDGNVRAVLSDRYRTIDNADLAEVILPKLTAAGCEIASAELTDRRFYIKAITPRIQFEVKKGDVVQAGLVISNSEVGCGSVRVEPLVFRLVCLNGMIAADQAMRKYHVGRYLEDGDGDANIFKSETLLADNRAFFLKVRDTVDATLNETKFEVIASKLMKAASDHIKINPVEVIDRVSTRFGFSEEEKGGVLKHLINGGDLSRWGVLNAITRQSQDIQGYDRATEFERFGGDVMELTGKAWETVAVAA